MCIVKTSNLAYKSIIMKTSLCSEMFNLMGEYNNVFEKMNERERVRYDVFSVTLQRERVRYDVFSVTLPDFDDYIRTQILSVCNILAILSVLL